jgi:hypothetical protein
MYSIGFGDFLPLADSQESYPHLLLFVFHFETIQLHKYFYCSIEKLTVRPDVSTATRRRLNLDIERQRSRIHI